MINVILDSSILRKFPYFNKPEYYLLAKLSELGVIRINIPDFVLRECCSAQQVELKQKMKTLISHLDKIHRNTELETEKKIIDANKKLIINQIETISDQINKRFENFITELSINVLENKKEYGEIVIKDYFEGNPPFPEPKRRDDIPDAFIYQAIMNFKKESYIPEITFICNDGNFSKAVQKERIEVFASLEEFFKSPKVAHSISRINEASEVVCFLKDNIKSHEESIVTDLKEVIENFLSNNEIEHYNIPDDNNTAHIYSFNGFNDLTVEFDELSVYLENVYTVNFHCNIEAEILYYYYKADYWAEDPEDMKKISISDHNKHYFEATQEVSIEISGRASLLLDIEGFSEYENKNDIFEDIKIKIEDYEVDDLF